MEPLRIIELFGGIGACSKALEKLGIPYEIADYVEIDKYAVASFNAIHGTDFVPQDITEWDKKYWCPNCGYCFATGKFSDNDDEMYEDVCPYCGCYPTEPIEGNIDLIMHGSPCQDFSAAGLGAGGDEGSGTRSSLMYETIRIVEKIKPKYVIWENVKNVLSAKHRHNFDAYLERMQKLGYVNYYQVLNAKNYGIPQNRERVFVVSVRSDINGPMPNWYSFPEPIPLAKRLKDILDDNVDESFYLDDEKVKKIKMSTFNQARTRIQEGDISQTLCARDWKDPKCVKVGDLDIKGHDAIKRVYDANGLSPTLTTMGGGNREPKIIDPQGRLDKVNTPKDYAPTLRAQDHGNPPMAIVDDTYANRDPRVYDKYSPALRSERSGLKVTEPFIVASRGRNPDNPSDRTAGAPTEQRFEPKLDGTSNTITTVQKDNYVATPYRVRKLTPKECWRLMGFDDTDFAKAEKVNSKTQLYKQAGNSIVVDVLQAVLGNLLK